MLTKKNKKIYTKKDYKNGDGMLTAVWVQVYGIIYI